MTTILTETGWENENGNLLGRWTNQADLVASGTQIKVFTGVMPNTLGGDDIIIGISNFTPFHSPQAPPPGLQLIQNGGITNFDGMIKTGKGNDNIIGTGIGFGISNRGNINTGNGNDNLIGNGNCVGIFNSAISGLGIIKTGKGNDNIIGTTDSNSAGIVNFGRIETGKGNDNIIAISNDNITGTDDCVPINFNSTLVNLGMIDTGNGNDQIIGKNGKSEGIENRRTGTIKTGKGSDLVMGNGDIAGITNLGIIETGNGKDKIIGTSSNGSGEDIAGINNTGTIHTGKGNDLVDALTGGFASFGRIPVPEGDEGVGMIDLGQGRDLIKGFGEQIVDGGRGFDTAELGIDYDQELLSFGSSFDIKIGDMVFSNVEKFTFTERSFTLEELQAEVI